MESVTSSIEFMENTTFPTITSASRINMNIRIIQTVTASVGIVANINVVVFLNHKKFRRKIPNIFIINQVSVIQVDTFANRKLLKLFQEYVLVMVEIIVQEMYIKERPLKL